MTGLSQSLCPASVNAAEERVEPAAKVDYNREVRPILAKNCFACHGQDEAKRAKGLRLDRRDAATQPLKSGETAVVPGDPESSELILKVTEEDETLRMPPKKMGARLAPAEVNVLRRWIAQGADYPPHWAFVAPRAWPIPKVQGKSWPRNGIDFWILDRLKKEGLEALTGRRAGYGAVAPPEPRSSRASSHVGRDPAIHRG